MSIRIQIGQDTLEVPVKAGCTLLDMLREQKGVSFSAPCGGKGKCGKCTVQLGDGRTVLACQTPAEDGMTVLVPQQHKQHVMLQGASAKVKPDEGLEGYGIACDIGTTTVVCHLMDLKRGIRLATAGEGNRQQVFGADVISRIRAAEEDHLEELAGLIRGQLSDMIQAVCQQAGIQPGEIRSMAVAANTTMCHLLTGLDPSGIGRAPFVPKSNFGTEVPSKVLNLPFDGPVYIAPAVSGYVGGDITSDLVAVEIQRKQKPVLLIDVGTNGEMVLGCGDKLLCCSTAAGPAFEGAQIRFGMTAKAGAIHSVEYRDGQVVCSVLGDGEAVGICGSGLIDAIAVMLDLGALDETGRILDPEEDDDIPDAALPWLFLDENEDPAFRLTEQVWVTQSDVRKVQLGKGAIAAGEQVLINAYGVRYDEIGTLYLAGGFGSYIRPASAARIGMIPQELLPVTAAAGNTAAEGACMALLSAQVRSELEKLHTQMQYIELSGKEEFNQAYMEAMMFPYDDETKL